MVAANASKPAEFKKQFIAYQTQQLRTMNNHYISGQNKAPAEAKVRNSEYRKQKAALDDASDFRPSLRNQLQAFITLCNDVDFGAKLVKRGAKFEFANSVYVDKPIAWKQLFRLGKEPVMAAQIFAQEWLTSLR